MRQIGRRSVIGFGSVFVGGIGIGGCLSGQRWASGTKDAGQRGSFGGLRWTKFRC